MMNQAPVIHIHDEQKACRTCRGTGLAHEPTAYGTRVAFCCPDCAVGAALRAKWSEPQHG